MSTLYHILSKKDTDELAKPLAANGQMILSTIELIERSQMALDELIDTLGGQRSRRCSSAPRRP